MSIQNPFPSDLFDKKRKPNENVKIKSSKEALSQAKPVQYSTLKTMNNPAKSSFSIWESTKKFNNKLSKSKSKKVFTESTFDKKTYTSFSGADTKVSISFKGGKPVAIGEAQTVTYSLYRPMNPVYNLGSAKPAGYVRGQRTIAGSIIFTVFDRNVLMNAFYHAFKGINAKCVEKEYLSDELPPFDIHMTFTNEYGQAAFLVIHDVYITSEGQVMSIEDMITENTMQYLATDITIMQPLDRKG